MDKLQILINTGANVFNFVFSFGISFFLSPYIVTHIGREAYGFVSLGNQFVSYATIATSALNSMLSRFVSIEIYRNNTEERNKYFSSAVFANIIISLLMLIPCCLLIVFLEKVIVIPDVLILDVKLLWSFIFANFLLGLLTNSYNIAVFAKNKLYLNSLRSIETKVINILILLCLFAAFKPSVWYVGFAGFICTFYSLAYNIHYTGKFFPDMKCRIQDFSNRHIKQLLSAGIWNSFAQLATVLNTGLDLLICNLFIGASAMGTMSIAKLLPSNIVAIAPLFGDTFLPEMTKNYAMDDRKALFRNIDFSRKVMALIGSIMVGVAMVNAGAFFELWMPAENAQTLHMISSASLVAYVFITSLAPVSNVITIANKQKVAVINYFVCGVINLGLVFALLKMIDNDTLSISFLSKEELQLLIVAGTSSIITILRDTTIVTLYAAKCLNYPWYCFYPTLVRAVCANTMVMGITVICKTLVPINSWITFFLSCGISAVLGGTASAVVLFKREQIRELYNMAARITFKRKYKN